MASKPTEWLSFDDAQILRLESPSIAGHTLKVLLLEPGSEALTVTELRRLVAGRLDREPRARQRIAFPPLRLAPPAWVDDPEFEIDAHIQAHETDPGLELDDLPAVSAAIMAERLDPSRPLWRLDLVGPLADGRSAIVARVHHAMADGIASMRLFSAILWDEIADAEPGVEASWQPEAAPSGIALAAAGLRDRLGAVPQGAGRMLRGLADPSRWRDGARELAALPGALARELRPAVGDSPLDRTIGSDRELGFVVVPLADLKAIGAARPGHVTVNDVLLAVVAGGLRTWLADHPSLPELRVQIPVSLHHRSERPDELGNRDSFLNVDLPLDEPDPLRRLDRINAETTERKELGDAQELYNFFHALSRFRPLYRAGMKIASSAREFSLSVSNVPGPREARYVAGRRLERLTSFSEPAAHHALRVSAISSAGNVSIGLCTDPRALAGLDRLEEAIAESLAELRAAAL